MDRRVYKRGEWSHPDNTKAKPFKEPGQAPHALLALILLCALNAQTADAMTVTELADLQRQEGRAAPEPAALHRSRPEPRVLRAPSLGNNP